MTSTTTFPIITTSSIQKESTTPLVGVIQRQPLILTTSLIHTESTTPTVGAPLNESSSEQAQQQKSFQAGHTTTYFLFWSWEGASRDCEKICAYAPKASLRTCHLMRMCLPALDEVTSSRRRFTWQRESRCFFRLPRTQ